MRFLLNLKDFCSSLAIERYLSLGTHLELRGKMTEPKITLLDTILPDITFQPYHKQTMLSMKPGRYALNSKGVLRYVSDDFKRAPETGVDKEKEIVLALEEEADGLRTLRCYAFLPDRVALPLIISFERTLPISYCFVFSPSTVKRGPRLISEMCAENKKAGRVVSLSIYKKKIQEIIAFLGLISEVSFELTPVNSLDEECDLNGTRVAVSRQNTRLNVNTTIAEWLQKVYEDTPLAGELPTERKAILITYKQLYKLTTMLASG